MRSEPAIAFVFAHPGHELRVHHWLEASRPVVHVLTDGSGSLGQSRLAATARVLGSTGARSGRCFGRFTDRALYALLLDRSFEVFRAEARALADDLDDDGIDTVAGDAIEGFNPGHDVARLLLNAAVGLLRARGRRVRNLEFDVEAPPGRCDEEERDVDCRLHLGDEAFSRKIAAARAYEELGEEVARALGRHGEYPFRCECLRPAPPSLTALARLPRPLPYEVHGASRVAAGTYAQVVRLDDHLLPLAHDLEAFAGEPSP
jgi:hypothetical protein